MCKPNLRSPSHGTQKPPEVIHQKEDAAPSVTVRFPDVEVGGLEGQVPFIGMVWPKLYGGTTTSDAAPQVVQIPVRLRAKFDEIRPDLS